MLALALVTGLDALWGLLRTIDVPPSSDDLELAANALTALAITSLQYVVLRVVLNYRSAAATAWIPTSVALFVVEDFVAIYWFRDQMPAVIGFGFWAILSLGQGLVLADMLGRRSAVPLWLVAMGVVLGAIFLVGLIPGNLSGMNMLVQAVVGGAIVGLIYGGISGGFLLLLVRLAVRKPPQAPELQARASGRSRSPSVRLCRPVQVRSSGARSASR